MVATFVLEIALAAYTIYRYKFGPKTRAIVALLVCLAAFQLAEYFVCTNSGIAMGSARAGYVAITALPGLGFYLMGLLTKPLTRKQNLAIIGSTLVVAAYFLLAPQAFDAYRCTGNYVIFQIGMRQAAVYSLFYFGLILASLLRGARFLGSNPEREKARPVQWLLAGYAMFIVPVAILTVLHPDTGKAVPSIMCGFAVTLAVVLVAKVAPLSIKKR